MSGGMRTQHRLRGGWPVKLCVPLIGAPPPACAVLVLSLAILTAPLRRGGYATGDAASGA